MSSFLKQVWIPTATAIAGGLIVFTALRVIPATSAETAHSKASPNNEAIYDDIWNKQNGILNQFDSIFNDDVFDRNNPFEEMRKMRDQMEKRMQLMANKDHHVANPFDSWFSGKFGGGSVDDITQREDEKFVYYDIKVADLNSTSINTKVENGYLTINGTIEKRSEAPDEPVAGKSVATSYFKSSFNRVFPVPENVDSTKMEMSSEKDKVVVRFPKLTT
jgi:HSP20 family molecular chaperone IbpA